MRGLSAPAAFVVLAVVAGCSDSVAPGFGRAEAIVQDDPGNAINGSLAGNVSASVWSGTAWVALGSPNGITIPLQGVGEPATVHGEVDVRGGSYSRVRLVFEGVTARVNAGSVVGGTALASDVDIQLGGDDASVEVVVNVPGFTVTADPAVRRTIVFRLRSHLWLTAAAVQAGQVSDASLIAAIQASTRLDPR